MPWFAYPLRVYQANNFETDPVDMNGDAIAQQCADLHCNALIVDAGGGISTFYPSEAPYLTPNPHLAPGRDFLGEVMAGCRVRGIRVFARNDFGNMSVETAERHPDWALRGRDGRWSRVYDVVYTCPSSPMFLEVPPEAFREQIRRYDVDGIYINSLGGRCYCDRCRRLFAEETGRAVPASDDWDDPDFRAWIEWGYDLVDRIARTQYEAVKQAKPDCAYFIDAAGPQEHGWIRGKGQDLVRQARFQSFVATESFNDIAKGYPPMLAPFIARYVRRVADRAGKPGAVFVSAFPGHSWPRSAQPVEQYRAYSASVYFNGCSVITPWYGHCRRDDQRIVAPAREVFAFIEAHEKVLAPARPVAPVALVYSRRTADYYGRERPVERYMQGVHAACRALVEEHVPFCVIPEDDLEGGWPGETRLLILADTVCLSEAACAHIDAFVAEGGAVLATYETSLMDETGARREQFGLRCLGVSLEGLPPDHDPDWAGSRQHAYLRIEAPAHFLFEGFDDTRLLPHKGPWLRVSPGEHTNVPARFVEPSSSQPPEKGWRGPASEAPMLVAGSGGRVVYAAFPLFDLYARYGLPDFRRLVGNAVRGLTALPIRVNAPAAVEVCLLENDDGLVIGLVNHAAGLLREHAPVALGPIILDLPEYGAGSVRRLNGSVLEKEVLHGALRVRIERLETHELILITGP